MAALALAGAATAAAGAGAAFAQSAPDTPAQSAPRPVDVKPTPVPAPTPGPAVARAQAQPGQPPGDPAAARPPSDEQQRAIELYRAHFGGQLTKASYLGVSTSPVPAALRQHLGLPEGVGLVVDFVEPDSPAQAAGLKQYDILTRLNEQILVNSQQLAVLVRSYKAGEEVKLALIRGGKEQSLTAKLKEKEVKPIEDMFQNWAGDDPNLFGALQARRAREERTARDRERERANRNRADGGNPPPAPGKEDASAGRTSERTMMVWSDNDATLTLSKRGGEEGRHLVVTDKSGKVVFDGNLENEKDREKLPKGVAEKVKQMESKLPPGAGGAWPDQDKDKDKSKGKDGDKEQGRGDRNGEVRGSVDFAAGREFNVAGAFDFAPDDGRRSDAKIGDNDVLAIAIRGIHGPDVNTVKTARVRDGRVNLPFVAPVKCEGRTEVELEKQIVKAYAEAKVSPNVTVRVRKLETREAKP
jgi:hypothetical protein